MTYEYSTKLLWLLHLYLRMSIEPQGQRTYSIVFVVKDNHRMSKGTQISFLVFMYMIPIINTIEQGIDIVPNCYGSLL